MRLSLHISSQHTRCTGRKKFILEESLGRSVTLSLPMIVLRCAEVCFMFHCGVNEAVDVHRLTASA